MPFCGKCGQQIAEGETCSCELELQEEPTIVSSSASQPGAYPPPEPPMPASQQAAPYTSPAPQTQMPNDPAPSYGSAPPPPYGAAPGAQPPAYGTPPQGAPSYGAAPTQPYPGSPPPPYGGTTTGAPPYGAAPTQPYGQPPYGAPGYAPPRKAPAFDFGAVLRSVRRSLSFDVQNEVCSAAKVSAPNWAILLGIVCLANALVFTSVFSGTFRSLFDSMGLLGRGSLFGTKTTTHALLSELGIGVWAQLLCGIIYKAIEYFAIVALVLCGTRILKVNAGFAGIANMTATAMVPAAVVSLLAAAFGFLSVPVSMFMVFFSGVITLALVFCGTQSMVDYQKKHFWFFIIAFVVFTLVMLGVLRYAIIPVFTSEVDGGIEELASQVLRALF